MTEARVCVFEHAKLVCVCVCVCVCFGHVKEYPRNHVRKSKPCQWRFVQHNLSTYDDVGLLSDDPRREQQK